MVFTELLKCVISQSKKRKRATIRRSDSELDFYRLGVL